MRIGTRIVFLIAAIVACGMPGKSFGATPFACTLEWNPSIGTDVTGYAIYYGISGSTVTNRADFGSATTGTIDDLTAATDYFFYGVAYDSSLLESDPSNIVPYTTPIMSSVRLNVVAGNMSVSFNVAPGTACHVEYTDTLSPANWQVLTSTQGDSSGVVTVSDSISGTTSTRFYRAVIP